MKRKPKKPTKRATRTKAAKRPAGKPAKRAPAKPARRKRPAKPAKRPKPAAKHARSWLAFVERHGVVLASARGPVPSIAEAVAGEAIVGSWWAHPKGKAIFAALSDLDDSIDVRCFKLIDGKVTFVHRKLWPALVRLARDGVLPADRLISIQQEHMPTGEHRNIATPFPDWVPDDAARAADHMTTGEARDLLGSWI